MNFSLFCLFVISWVVPIKAGFSFGEGNSGIKGLQDMRLWLDSWPKAFRVPRPKARCVCQKSIPTDGGYRKGLFFKAWQKVWSCRIREFA